MPRRRRPSRHRVILVGGDREQAEQQAVDDAEILQVVAEDFVQTGPLVEPGPKEGAAAIRCPARSYANPRITNRCRHKRRGPNSSDKRGMAPNKDRPDSRGSIRQAHLPDAQSEGAAGPKAEWHK